MGLGVTVLTLLGACCQSGLALETVVHWSPRPPGADVEFERKILNLRFENPSFCDVVFPVNEILTLLGQGQLLFFALPA